MESQVYTIDELAELVQEINKDIKPRTIRYYIAEGLLQKPDERGQYTRAHLRQLQIILRYKEAFLPLEQIKSRLDGLTDRQIEEQLARLDSAADYTARLLAKQKQIAPGISQLDRVAPAGVFERDHPAYQRRMQLSTEQDKTSNASLSHSGLEDANKESWERLPLIPGVELHVRMPASSEMQEYIRNLLVYAQTLRKPTR